MKEIKKFIKYSDVIQDVIQRNIAWKAKYNIVFSENMWSMIEGVDIDVHWFDPDTSYKEDVMSYAGAVKAIADELKEVIDENG